MQKDILFLFTNEYPYGSGEGFIENELNQHLKYFKTVKIFPLIKKGTPRVIDERVKVIDLFENVNYDPLKILFTCFVSFFKIFLKEFNSAKSKIVFYKQIPVLKSILLQNFNRAELLKKQLDKEGDLKSVVFYSYWTDEWATVLSILKKENKIHGFISRAHGYDLYAERWPDSLIPFRNLQIENVGKIFTVSKDGLQYLQKNFPDHKNKFYLNHLNIFDNGIGPFEPSQVFTIVSCSNLIPLKRVQLIAKTLCKIGFDLKWVHFGDGIERDKIVDIVRKMSDNIIVELKGFVPNAEIIKFYQTNTVNVFIQLSETEGGVPISLQEAASFGVPLIGTIAGGAEEIVNESTGIPLPIDINESQLSEIIIDFKGSYKNTIEFREGVRSFWKNSFSLDSNYIQLYKNITQ